MNKLKWKSLISLMMTILLAASGLPAVAAAETPAAQTITILHTNDIHGRVEESSSGIGYTKVSALVRQMKEKNPHTLVLDAGDTLHGQTIANLVRGESVVAVMNAIGYDAMTAGNHDFNYGHERLVELGTMTKFPILGANVKKEDGTGLLESYIIKEVGGVKIGIFGLSTPETAYKTHPNNVKGITFADPVAEAKQMVDELEGQVDAIVALAHLGVDESSADTSIKVAEQVPGIDLIIDGHSHTKLENGMVVGETLIAQTGEYNENLGMVELTFEGNKLVNKQASLIEKAATDSIEPDAAIAGIIDNLKKEQELVLSQVVGTTNVNLAGEREVVRVGESNLGNLITDAMLDETGADVAITNGGGIRASIDAGEITKGEVISVLPFGNYIQTKKVKGSVIKAALEHGVSAYPESLGAFPHVAGIRFELDASKPKGERVVSATVQGEPLDMEREYMLATNDFMAAGGDQYTMFADAPVAQDYSSLEESLIAYLQKKGTVEPQVEGRITVVNSAQPAETVQPEPSPQPAPPAEAAPAQPVPPVVGQETLYVVKPGDSLWKIAKQYGTTWQNIHRLNQLPNPDLIFPGQQLRIPAN